MANEFRTLESHSAEYFGDTRDYWWNADFLELIGKRLEFDRVSDVLDVGCGVGHWGRVLAKVLPGGAHVRGVDRDPLWVEKAELRAAALGLADRFVVKTLGSGVDLATLKGGVSGMDLAKLESMKDVGVARN